VAVTNQMMHAQLAHVAERHRRAVGLLLLHRCDLLWPTADPLRRTGPTAFEGICKSLSGLSARVAELNSGPETILTVASGTDVRAH
jgi:hypothetical protein